MHLGAGVVAQQAEGLEEGRQSASQPLLYVGDRVKVFSVRFGFKAALAVFSSLRSSLMIAACRFSFSRSFRVFNSSASTCAVVNKVHLVF